MTLEWEKEVRALLRERYKIIEVYDDGTAGANEVSRVELADGREVVMKVMLSTKIYHQRRKAITEVAFASLDERIGGDRACPNLYADLFRLTPEYIEWWGAENVEQSKRMCSVIREFCDGLPGSEWRGQMYSHTHNLPEADNIIRGIIETNPSAERISVLDFVTINQDRSARNWLYSPALKKFWAIDNGMAWFHEYPETEQWKAGCVIDDVILQVGTYHFISGVFTTLWAGRPLSAALLSRLEQFDTDQFLENITHGSHNLGFPPRMAEDWRFEGLLRRLAWITAMKRQPTAEEYRAWHRGSPMMTPPEIVATGGKVIWQISWDFDDPEELK